MMPALLRKELLALARDTRTLLLVTLFAILFIAVFVNAKSQVAEASARKALAEGLPDWTLLNVNIPKGAPKGIRVTRQGFKEAKPVISEHTDPRGKLYYWIGEVREGFRAEGGTDFEAIDEGYVSVTPMRSDLTNHAALEGMKAWNELKI